MTPRCFHALYLRTSTPIGDGAKNLGAEKTVTLGLEGAVVDGLGLGDFAVRPGANFSGLARECGWNRNLRSSWRDHTGLLRYKVVSPSLTFARAADRFLGGPAEKPKKLVLTSCQALPGLSP